MKFYCPLRSLRWFSCIVLLGLLAPAAQAQRQMERLGRGLMVLHSATSQAYVGWRLLANDPADMGFNVYRVANGGGPVKLNAAAITNATSFLDTTATFTVTNYWYVKPVTNGVEGPASGMAGLAASSPVRQYLPLPLSPVIGGPNPPYTALACWPGDLDGNGEFDYVVMRTSVGTNNVPPYQFVQAYKGDGTLLWQLNAGPNSTNQYSYGPGSTALTFGDSQHVMIYDLDGDGQAEVMVKTGNGVATLTPAGTTITNITAANAAEFISVFDGLTGVEKARCVVTNPWPADGVMYGRFGIVYADGVHPALVFSCGNRNDTTSVFQECMMAYDYRPGQLTQRWFALNNGVARGHQIRLADVDHDGQDDLVELGGVYRANDGSRMFGTALVHGDRFHVADMDPERPGLETFAIQQNNGTLLATAQYESGTGKMIKQLYTGSVADVGRGDAGDFDPRYLGMEAFSTVGGLYDAKGNLIPNASVPFPTLGIWWDADLRREFMSGAGATLESPTIDKWVVNTTYPNGANIRQYSIYNEGVYQGYGGRPAFIGDIFGDWREEVMLMANNHSELRIYCTKIMATNRLYCLMQNPAYRVQCLCRAYTQSPFTDYYLGENMSPPCPPPASEAKLVWRGNGANVWGAGTANWQTNWNYAINSGTNPVAYAAGDSVLFDLTGSNQTAVSLSGPLTPGAVTVYSPKDFIFGGSGSLGGAMKLTKVGGGKLTLAGTHTYTGATTVWEGPLIVNGGLTASPVTVRGGVWLDGALAGTGTVAQAVTIHGGGSVSPGNGTNSPGTLTLAGGLTETGGAFNRFDLSDDPTGTVKTNDRLRLTGNLTLTGTNRIVIHRLNGALPQGTVYPLITYTGTLAGSLTNLVVEGLADVPVALTNPPGQIALVVKSYPAPATITWTGGSGGNAWDLLAATNWLQGAAKRQFAPNDSVRFDSHGATNPLVNLTGNLAPASVTVDAANDYTLAGPGGLIGSASLTKTNSGTLTISAANHTFTGKTLLAGGTLVVSELAAVGFPSPLGNPPGGSTNLILAGNSTLRVTGESYTDRGLTLGSGTNAIEVLNAADQVTLAGQIIGPGALLKSGPGTLALSVSNGYSGGTFVLGGSLSLGSVEGNKYGLGSGLVTISNATVSLMNLQASENCAWRIRVPANGTATINCDGRSTMSGALTGGGTLNVYTPYVRTDFNGDWSAFTGQIHATGGNFRANNAAGYPLARFQVGSAASLQNRVGGTPTIFLGELSGAPGGNCSVSGGNDGLAVNWSVGALNTSATFAGNTYGAVGFIKTGTGTWTWSGTNLTHTGSTMVNGGTLLINGHAAKASSAVTVGSAGTLGGTGVIGGVTTVNGRLSPGSNTIGTLTFTNQVTLGGGSTTFIELNRATGTHDRVNVGGGLNCGGTLQVTNLSGMLTQGDRFKIFDAPAYAGAFTGFKLPALGTNLAWDTNSLLTTGTLAVISTVPPRFASVVPLPDGSFRLTFSGPASRDYELRASTNLALTPITLWELLAGGTFGSGPANYDDVTATNHSQRFYRIVVP